MTTFAEFRAGKLNMRGTRVTADPRKGTLKILQDEDSLVHLQWIDRSNGNVEEDLIIVPGEATFTRVAQCTTGRVYVLKYSQMDDKKFFWMQEPKEEKDAEVIPIVQRVLATGSNATAAAGGAAGGRAGALGAAGLGGLAGLDQDTLMSIIRASGGMGAATTQPSSRPPAPAAAAPAAATAAGGAGGLTSQQLQQMIQGLSVPAGAGGGGAAQPAQASLNLRDVLNADDVIPLLAANPDIVAAVAGDLPDEDRTPEQVASLLRSPQFAQALGSLTGVLQSGQGDAVIRSLGLEGRPTLGGDAVRAFLEAIQRAAGAQSSDTEMRDAPSQ